MLTIPRNIVALFDDRLTQEFIRLSEEINRHIPSAIILNDSDMIPHMTLYTTNYAEKNEQKVSEKLAAITKGIHPFTVSLTQPAVDMLGVWINVEITSTLQHVHEHIVDGLNAFREGLYDEK